MSSEFLSELFLFYPIRILIQVSIFVYFKLIQLFSDKEATNGLLVVKFNKPFWFVWKFVVMYGVI